MPTSLSPVRTWVLPAIPVIPAFVVLLALPESPAETRAGPAGFQGTVETQARPEIYARTARFIVRFVLDIAHGQRSIGAEMVLALIECALRTGDHRPLQIGIAFHLDIEPPVAGE